ncbi:MAG: toll/interleukin-1 receptor domain-containing protein [Clostridia bacterium]|nr:toll/interleukin-1 receptor domain-containing protein [Clostridia bacterium]
MACYLGFQPTDEKEYYFVSYNSEDVGKIGPIVQKLNDSAVPLWYDYGLEYGEKWESQISSKIKDAKAIILFFTKGILSKDESYVRKEYDIATEYFGKKVYVILLDKINNNDISFDMIPWWYEIKKRQCVVASEIENLEEICNEIKKAIKADNNIVNYKNNEKSDKRISVYNGQLMENEKTRDPKKHIENKILKEKSFDKTDEVINCNLTEKKESNTLTSLNSTVEFLCEKGRYTEALGMCERVYSLSCETYGEEHSKTIAPLNKLAYINFRLHDYNKAKDLYVKSYLIRCFVLGEQQQCVIEDLYNIEKSFYEESSYNEALMMLKIIYSLDKEVLDRENQDAILYFNNLANVHIKLHNYEKAIEMYEKVYALRCNMLGIENSDTIASLVDLALTYIETNNYEKALMFSKKAYLLSCKAFGKEHPNTIMPTRSLACVYKYMGDYKKAIELDEKAHSMVLKEYGENSSEFFESMDNLITLYDSSGDLSMAVKLNEKAYAISCKLFGRESQKAKAIFNDLSQKYSRFSNEGKLYLLERMAQELYGGK